MKQLRAHKIRLDPNSAQEIFFRRCVGTARFAYNWALAAWKADYEDGGKPREGNLRRRLNAVKPVEFPWMLEVPKGVVQQAIKNVGRGYVNFFRKTAKFPRFKSKHSSKQSARLDNGPGTFFFDGKSVRLPKIGRVRTFEELRWPDGRPISATLKLEAGRWFLSVQVEVEAPERAVENQDRPAVGIDLGITSAVTLSTGEKYDAPKPLKAALVRLARAQRVMCRRKKGSKNREKARLKVARLHWHIAEIRKDWTHKLTADIAKRFGVVCTEDLNVKGMVRNHCLGRAISDVGFGEITRQLGYKATLQKVGRFYPSSKTCRYCGHVMAELPLNARSWKCPECGCVHDRDINAAQNIEDEGLRIYTASCAGINACGETGATRRLVYVPVQPDSTKQEESEKCFAHA